MWLALNPSVFRYTCQTNVAGPERDRTADLLNANQALSQLSYRPVAGHGDMVERFVAKSKNVLGGHPSCRLSDTGGTRDVFLFATANKKTWAEQELHL